MRNLCLVGLALLVAILGTDLVKDAQPANDCAMVKKPAPGFSSAMRVITPDPKVKHAMRVTVVPPCKPS